MNIKCAIASGAVLTAAGSALAGPIFIFEQSQGTFDVTFEDANTRDVDFDTTVNFEIGGLGILIVDGSFTQTFVGGNPDLLAGTAMMTGASNADTLSVSFDGLIFDNNFESYSGTWTLTGSTGAYAQYTSGGGNDSGSFFFTGQDAGQIFMIFQGELVPTPGVLGIAGMASCLVCVRRRRA